VEQLPVKTADGVFKLGELALVQPKSSSLYVIDMISVPQYIPNIVEAVNKSNLSLNPQVDKTSVFLRVPAVTRDHRENLDKAAKQLYQNMLKKLREIYSVNIKKAENQLKISVDDVYAAKDTVTQFFSK
jgi:ribosome recycling factor